MHSDIMRYHFRECKFGMKAGNICVSYTIILMRKHEKKTITKERLIHLV